MTDDDKAKKLSNELENTGEEMEKEIKEVEGQIIEADLDLAETIAKKKADDLKKIKDSYDKKNG